MIAPDQVPDIWDPKIAAWSPNVRGLTVWQPVSEKKIGMLYWLAFFWSSE